MPWFRFGRKPSAVECAKQGDVDGLRHALQKGKDMEKADECRNKPIHMTAFYGHLDALQFLVEDAGVDVDARDHRWLTPLHHAAMGGHVHVLKYLLGAGCRVDARGREGTTAAHHAARMHVNTLRYLIEEAGADVETRDDRQCTVAHHAYVPEVVRYLVQRGVDMEARDITGRTPLNKAAAAAWTEAVESLIECGADVDAPDYNGRTPVHSACETSLDMVRLLVEGAGAEVDAADRAGITPLVWAAQYAQNHVVEWLLHAGADPEVYLKRQGKRKNDQAQDAVREAVVRQKRVCASTYELLMSRSVPADVARLLLQHVFPVHATVSLESS